VSSASTCIMHFFPGGTGNLDLILLLVLPVSHVLKNKYPQLRMGVLVQVENGDRPSWK
jgi:hypothetical protein